MEEMEEREAKEEKERILEKNEVIELLKKNSCKCITEC